MKRERKQTRFRETVKMEESEVNENKKSKIRENENVLKQRKYREHILRDEKRKKPSKIQGDVKTEENEGKMKEKWKKQNTRKN